MIDQNNVDSFIPDTYIAPAKTAHTVCVKAPSSAFVRHLPSLLQLHGSTRNPPLLVPHPPSSTSGTSSSSLLASRRATEVGSGRPVAPSVVPVSQSCTPPLSPPPPPLPPLPPPAPPLHRYHRRSSLLSALPPLPAVGRGPTVRSVRVTTRPANGKASMGRGTEGEVA